MTLPLMKIIDVMSSQEKGLNRQSILYYEENIAKNLPQMDIPVKHYIHGGMYAREITIPKGTLLTGQIYKYDHFDIMISGDITVSTDCGERKRFTGYNLFNGLSGKKRAGYTHEDTTWVTVHPFTGENGEKIQEMITARDFEELELFYKKISNDDFRYFLTETSYTEEEIKTQSSNKSDRVFCYETLKNVEVKDSKINGKGLFAVKSFIAGDVICKARIGSLRTQAGAFANHSPIHNAYSKVVDGNIVYIANRPIGVGDEITLNYRLVLKDRLENEDLLCQE